MLYFKRGSEHETSTALFAVSQIVIFQYLIVLPNSMVSSQDSSLISLSKDLVEVLIQQAAMCLNIRILCPPRKLNGFRAMVPFTELKKILKYSR